MNRFKGNDCNYLYMQTIIQLINSSKQRDRIICDDIGE